MLPAIELKEKEIEHFIKDILTINVTIIIFSALLFKDRSLKTSNFRKEHKLPSVMVVSGLGSSGSFGPAVTRPHLVSIKGKCCCFLNHLWDYDVFLFESVVPSDSPLPCFQGQLFCS